MSSLSVRQVKGGVVYPTIRVPSHPGKLLMGVYDEAGDYVSDTVLDRRSGEQGAPVPPGLFPVVTDAEGAEAIYAGPLYFHFGHFLLESLARAWFARTRPDLPLVWAGAHTWKEARLRPWQAEILDILGIGNPTIIVADPTRFQLLHVPDIGYRYDDRFHPEHAEFLGRYEGPAQVPGSRLYLSRGKLDSDARDFNPEPTELRLATAGWTVSHPEKLSVRDQLAQLSAAELVAGEEGSAFHTLALLSDVSSKRFLVLRRRGQEHPNMHTVGDARHVNQTFHTLENERVFHADGRVVSKANPNSSEILDLLGVPVPPRAAAGPLSADQVVVRNAVASLRPERLLAIGSRTPDLVDATASTRVEVSPRFDFDPRSYAGSGVDFYEIDLGRYADLFHEDRGPFDVIQIGGSDVETVMEAFRVSKRLAHDGTTWVFGSGELAARAAVAVRIAHPGYASKRVLVRRTVVYVATRVPGEPRKAAGVGKLPFREIARRTRWLPITRLRQSGSSPVRDLGDGA